MNDEQECSLNTCFRDIDCRQCGYKGKPEPTGKINDIHGYALQCPICNRFWGWSGRKKVLHDENGNRKISSIWTAKRLGIEYCQMCLRNKKQLGDAEQLEVHHVMPASEQGNDDPDNIWVICTACHKYIHHIRTYFNLHLLKFFDAYVKADDYDQAN